MEDEDEEVEGDRLSSLLTMFDRQQRQGGAAGSVLLGAVGGGYLRVDGRGLFWSRRIPRKPSSLRRKKKGGLEEKLRAKEFVCVKTAGGGCLNPK